MNEKARKASEQTRGWFNVIRGRSNKKGGQLNKITENIIYNKSEIIIPLGYSLKINNLSSQIRIYVGGAHVLTLPKTKPNMTNTIEGLRLTFLNKTGDRS